MELAGEVADGVMPYLWSIARVVAAKAWIARGRARSPGRAPIELSLGLPVYVGEDMVAVRELARQNLAFYATLPYYQRLLRLQGFAAEATRAEAARLLATGGGSRTVGVLYGADRFASFMALFVLIGGAALVRARRDRSRDLCARFRAP